MDKFKVELGERSYDIAIGSGMLQKTGGALKKFRFTGIAVVSNPTVYAIYGERLMESLKAAGFLKPVAIVIPDGEKYKTLRYMEHIWSGLLKSELDRKSAIIALGGGVIGDMAGFAASAYMRGIAYIQAPTTLLAQVDSSVGGKTGVNHPLGKNMIGTFYQPSLVWIDAGTLDTLPERQLLAGIAEVIKCGVIRDEKLFDYLSKNRSSILKLEKNALFDIIRRSCEIKAEVVSKDEREAGLRAILNYGHTLGHAIETVTGYKRYLHGEAVAIGMCEEARLAVTLGLMADSEMTRIRELVAAYSLPTEMPEHLDREGILAAMALDKKTLKGTPRFTLPEKIGKARVGVPVRREKIVKLIGR